MQLFKDMFLFIFVLIFLFYFFFCFNFPARIWIVGNMKNTGFSKVDFYGMKNECHILLITRQWPRDDKRWWDAGDKRNTIFYWPKRRYARQRLQQNGNKSTCIAVRYFKKEKPHRTASQSSHNISRPSPAAITKKINNRFRHLRQSKITFKKLKYLGLEYLGDCISIAIFIFLR